MMEPTATRQARHLAWIEENAETLRRFAREGYAKKGRGAVTVLKPPSGEGSRVLYITPKDVTHVVGPDGRALGWPDETVARMVTSYNPQTHMVVIVEEDERQSAYRVQIVTLPPESPRHARAS